MAAGRSVGPSDRALPPPPGPGSPTGTWMCPGTAHGTLSQGQHPTPSPSLLAPSGAHRAGMDWDGLGCAGGCTRLGWVLPGAALGAPLTVYGHLRALPTPKHHITSSQRLAELHAVIGAGILGLNVPDVDAEVCAGLCHRPRHAGEGALLLINGLVATAPALQPLHGARGTAFGYDAGQVERLPRCHRHRVLGLVQLEALSPLGTRSWAQRQEGLGLTWGPGPRAQHGASPAPRPRAQSGDRETSPTLTPRQLALLGSAGRGGPAAPGTCWSKTSPLAGDKSKLEGRW